MKNPVRLHLIERDGSDTEVWIKSVNEWIIRHKEIVVDDINVLTDQYGHAQTIVIKWRA